MKIRLALLSILSAPTSAMPLSAQVIDVDSVKLPPVKRKPIVASQGVQILGGSVIEDADATALLGKGFDVFTGEVKADAPCVMSDGNDGSSTQDNNFGGDDVFFNDTFTSLRSFTNSSKTGVSFGFTYKIIDASFEHGDTVESQLNSTDAFGRFYRRIVTDVQYRDGGKWSGKALNWLRSRDLENFTKACGTHYVRAIYRGHSIDQVLRFKLRNDKRTSSNSNSLSVGVKQLISFGVDDESSTTSVSKLSSISHSGHNHGAIVAPELTDDVASVKSLFQFATYAYPKAIAALKQKGDILLLDIRPYHERATLSYISRIPAWPDQILTQLRRKQDLISDLGTALLNLQFASKLSKADYDALYSAPPFLDLPGKLEAIVAAQTEAKAAVDQCELLVRSKTLPSDQARKLCTDKLDAAVTPAAINAATLTRNP